MVRIPEAQGIRQWLTSLPDEISYLIPSPPAGLRYEYAISALQASNGSGRSATIVIRARGANADERFVINPTRLSEEIIACGGGDYNRLEGSKSQLRFNEDGSAFRLEDVSYRCAHFQAGCPSMLRIRHWAPAPGNTAPKPENRPQRRCAECGQKGHRKQCCCDELGNCRVEIIWAHTHELDAIPPTNSILKRPNGLAYGTDLAQAAGPMKKPRISAHPGEATCVCFRLHENIRDGRKKLLSAQIALRSLKRTLREIDESNEHLQRELNSSASGALAAPSKQRYREELRAQVELLSAEREKTKNQQMDISPTDGNRSNSNLVKEKANETTSTQVENAQVDGHLAIDLS